MTGELGAVGSGGLAAGARPRVSFIMAAYNAARFLDRAVQSAGDQTMPDWQLVIIDDASTDDTYVRARAWAARDPRILAVTKPHGGLADTRNWGLNVADGEWCMFHDADDWLDPRCLERLLALADANPGAGACACAFTGVDGEGRLTTAYGVADLADPMPVLVRGPAVSCISVIVKTDTVRAVGGFDPALLSCEDWDLWLRLARIGVKFVSTRENLAFYRKVPGSLSTKTAQMIRFGLEVMDRAFRPDPRLAAFESPFQDGYPPEDALDIKARSVVYNTAVGLGVGHDPVPLIALGPRLDDWNFNPAEFSRNVLAAIAHGLAAREEDVARSWDVIGPALERLTFAMTAHGAARRQAEALRAHVEARARAAAAFATPTRCNGVLSQQLDLAQGLVPIKAADCEAGVLGVHHAGVWLGPVDVPVTQGVIAPGAIASAIAEAAKAWPLACVLDALGARAAPAFWLTALQRLADLRRWKTIKAHSFGQLKHDIGFLVREEMQRALVTAAPALLGECVPRQAVLPAAPTGAVIRSGAILLYRAVDANAGPTEHRIAATDFAAHLGAIQAAAVTPITVAQWAWLQHMRLPPRCAPLSIALDAGVTGPQSHAFAALARRGFVASIFAAWDDSGALGAGWTWDELAARAAEGHDIGLRQSALGPIGRMAPQALADALGHRLDIARHRLGPRPCAMLLDVAAIDATSRAVLRECGVRAAVVPRAGFNWLNGDPLDQSAMRVLQRESLDQVRAKFQPTLQH